MWQGYLSLQERGECFPPLKPSFNSLPCLKRIISSFIHHFCPPKGSEVWLVKKKVWGIEVWPPPPAAENPWHGESREAVFMLIAVCWCKRVRTVESSSCVSWIIWVRASGRGVMGRVKGVRLDKREKVSPDTFHPAQEGRKAIRVSRAGL